MDVYPLVFQPIFKPKIWGGRRLERLLAKQLPPTDPIGESWELADLEEDQSVVTAGPAKGKTLGELVKQWGTDLLGGARLFEGRFPLLIKYLDANETLSVQVHPDQATADRLGGRVRVKNEAWYVIDADKDGFIYRGLRHGVTADDLKHAIDQQNFESVLTRVPVRKGHAYYLPSGTVHALGAGVLVAEVQTPSDTTYRLYDWNRIDPATGSPRELHVEQALGCIAYDTDPITNDKPEHVGSIWTSVTSLVRCDSFVLERVRIVEGVEQPIPHQEMVIWMVLEGKGSLACDALSEPLSFGVGDTVLLPAAMKNGRVTIQQDAMWLEATVPVPSSLADYERPDRATLRDLTNGAGKYVQLDRPDDPEPPT
jgi:mannose-6-phosphate isomerase